MKMRNYCILASVCLAAIMGSVMPAGETENPDNKRLEELVKMKRQRMKERELDIQKSQAKLAPLMSYSLEELQMAVAVKVMNMYQDAKVISTEREPKYLGTICNEFDIDSIFNNYGLYGSRYGLDSIWNQYGLYGSQFSPHSVFNEFSTDPPIIIKDGKVVGRLTVNKSVSGAVDPSWLRFYFTY